MGTYYPPAPPAPVSYEQKPKVDIGTTFTLAFKFFKQNVAVISQIALAVAVLSIPVQIFIAQLDLQSWTVQSGDTVKWQPDAFRDSMPGAGGAAVLGVSYLLSLIASLIVPIVVAKLCANSNQANTPVKLRDGMDGLGKKVGLLTVAWLIALIPLIIGTAMCFLPGLFLLFVWSLVAPAIALDEVGAVQALKTSWRLVLGNLLAMLVVLLGAIAILFVAAFPSAIIGLASPVAGAVISAFVGGITTVLLCVLLAFAYLQASGRIANPQAQPPQGGYPAAPVGPPAGVAQHPAPPVPVQPPVNPPAPQRPNNEPPGTLGNPAPNPFG